MKKILPLLCLLLVCSPAVRAETQVIKQVFDIKTADLDAMYQFIPDYVAIDVGDSVRFEGTVGSHTAHSIQGMLPEGVEPITISYQKVSDIKFDKPGVYGIKCKVHHRYGMVALIVVGDPSVNIEEARAAALKRVSRRGQDKMKRLLDRAEASMLSKANNGS